jgi:hypothetical protein
MTTKHDIEDLISRVAELPDEAQDEFVRTLIEMRLGHLGRYDADDDERAAPASTGLSPL